MKLAIMQPYFLPYIGYWQLLAAVDKFVVFDDVHFINRGWINRNRILVGGRDHLFTVPLKGASQNRRIHELELAEDDHWRDKLLKTIAQAYTRAPQFASVFPVLEDIVRWSERGLAPFLLHSLTSIAAFLNITTQLVASSSGYGNQELKGQARILDICRREQAGEYVNPPGGMELYAREQFTAAGVRLRFLKPGNIAYDQFGGPFVPWLSIVDVLMFNGREQTRALLNDYVLE